MSGAPSDPVRRVIDLVLIGIFLAVIFLPPLVAIFGIGPTTSLTEKRAPVAPPPLVLDVPGLTFFHRNFEGYWNDAFGFRSSLVRAYNRVSLWLGVSPSAKVVVGTDGWLFVGDEYSAVEYYRATRPFTPEELVWWQGLLEARRDWLAERGIRYLFVVAPDKQDIYPEYMPAALNRVGTATRLDQLVTHLDRHSDLRLLDLRGALREAKAYDRPYERLDSHWNELGAWFAYAEIIKRLSVWFPRVQPVPLSEFERTWSTEQGNDLAMLLSLSDVMPGEYLMLVPRVPRRAHLVPTDGITPSGSVAVLVSETGDPALPRAVMFHDSFAQRLWPFLSEHFERIVYSWQYNFDPALVESEKPDVVLDEMVDRVLMATLSPNPDEVTRAWRDPQRRD